MKTTVDELKAYYVKIGGQASDVVGIDTIPDMIAKITAISGGGGGGGSDLPEVTDADNGDVLTVVDGEWSKAAPTGGGGGRVVLYPVLESGEYVAYDPAEDDTLPESEEGWNVGSAQTYCLSLENGGEALTYSELSEIFKNNALICVDDGGSPFLPKIIMSFEGNNGAQNVISYWCEIEFGSEAVDFGIDLIENDLH